MKIQIDVQNLKLPPVNTEEMLRKIGTGKAIIFTGAGFSKKAHNTLHEEPPLARELSKKIGSLANLGDNNEDLMYTSHLYLKHGDRLALLKLLKDSFVLMDVDPSHEKICSLPWRRFYTTNYDNSIELACRNIGKRVDSLDIEAKPKDYISQDGLCVHLNGLIENAKVDDLESKIKLTNSSYLSPQSFISSQWNYIFKRDLETASAIIFVGYSMYDMDVQRLLYQTDNLIDKTYFIVHNEATFQETFLLTDFGHVLPIGVEGFSSLIAEKFVQPNPQDEGVLLECFTAREVKHVNETITDTEIRDLLLFGKFNESQVDTTLSNNYQDFFLIERELLKDTIRLIENKNNILVHSELGNGKTIFLNLLSSTLTQKGYTVYSFNEASEYDDELAEIELIVKARKQTIIIIEGYSRAERLLRHININFPDELTLIIADRSAIALRMTQFISTLELKFAEVSLDQLTNTEISNFIDLLDNQGLWEELTALPYDIKFKKIKDEYNGQISGILLGLLKSPSIHERIRKITDELFENQLFKDTIFAIALCDIIDTHKTSSLISEISGNDSVYKMELRNNIYFKSLYRFVENGNAIETKSSLMSLAIINNCYSESYVKHKLLNVVKTFDNLRSISHESNKLFKSLLRFHVLEILLPQKQKALDSYYMELKKVCPWLKDSPHYWVQYAMCRISIGDTESAQTYLNDAYTLARSKDDYHTENIDTQQARLYLVKCIREPDGNKSFELFINAHNILIGLPDNGYKYRQIIPYKDVYDFKFKLFNKGNKVTFEHSCKALLKQINLTDHNSDDLTLIKRISFINKSKFILEDIIEKISSTRL